MSKQQMRLRFIEGGEGGGEPKPTPTPPGTNDDGDEPLGEGGKKALDAERAANKDLKARIKALEEAAKPPAPKPGPKPDEGVSDRIAALEQQLADEKAAREAAEHQSLRASVAAAKGVPEAFVTGETREDMEAAADAALAWRGSKPQPNPQQGTPPGKTGGSMAAGRDRYKQSHTT